MKKKDLIIKYEEKLSRCAEYVDMPGLLLNQFLQDLSELEDEKEYWINRTIEQIAKGEGWEESEEHYKNKLLKASSDIDKQVDKYKIAKEVWAEYPIDYNGCFDKWLDSKIA